MMVVLAASAFAVDIPKQGFGFQIGWAQPILRLNSPTSKDTLANTVKLHGFKVGVVYDASYVAGFGSTIGLNYTFGMANSGWSSKYSFNDYPKTRSLIMYHQLELFVDWQYKFEVAKETYLMLYTGPSLHDDLDPVHKTADNALKRLNVTWGVGAGFQYKRYFLRGGYDFGLINPYKNADFSTGNHTRGRLDQWNIKLGVYLWYTD